MPLAASQTKCMDQVLTRDCVATDVMLLQFEKCHFVATRHLTRGVREADLDVAREAGIARAAGQGAVRTEHLQRSSRRGSEPDIVSYATNIEQCSGAAR
jgi:hypothetical protein